jgi:hypothetical protein
MSSIGTEITTLDQIVLNTADTEFQGYMDNLKQQCSGNIYESIDSFASCSANLFPEFYLTEQGVQFADGMLNGALGWIPGIPSNLIQKAAGYISQYGKVALNALFHCGEDMIKAFDIAGDAAYYALDKVGLGAVGELVQGSVRNIIKFGKAMANIIANVTQEAISIFVNDIVPAAFHVFSAVTDAFLHPKEFFTNIVNNIGDFIKDPVGSIKSAIKAIANLGTSVYNAVKAVISKLVDVAKQVEQVLQDVLIDISKAIADAFVHLGNDIKDAAESIGHFFESIF